MLIASAAALTLSSMLAKREGKHRFCLIRDGMRLQSVNSWQKVLKNRVTEDEDATFGERRHLVGKIAAICVYEMPSSCEVLLGLAWPWPQTRSKTTIFQLKLQFMCQYCLPTRL